MEEEIGLRVPRNKAIVGKNIFSHESGIHTAGIIKNPFTYEPFPPELVGGKRNLMIGATSGTEVVRLKAEEALAELLGIKVQVEKTDSRIKAIHHDIQKMYDAEERRSSVSDEEMKDFVRKYFLYQVDGTEEESDNPRKAKKSNMVVLNPEFLPIDALPASATSLTAAKAPKPKPKKK
jgi:2-isopropylmalate synthase